MAGAIFRAVLQWRVVPWPGAAGSRLLAQGLTYTEVPAWEKSTCALVCGVNIRSEGAGGQGLALGDARSGCAKGLGFAGGGPAAIQHHHTRLDTIRQWDQPSWSKWPGMGSR